MSSRVSREAYRDLNWASRREFIRAERPWGFILFKRNIETRVKYPLLWSCGISSIRRMRRS